MARCPARESWVMLAEGASSVADQALCSCSPCSSGMPSPRIQVQRSSFNRSREFALWLISVKPIDKFINQAICRTWHADGVRGILLVHSFTYRL